MPLAKCVRCETLFNKIQSSVCGTCSEAEDDDFEMIRKTLEDNPEMNAEGIAEVSGVEIACVLRMMDSGAIAKISYGEAVKCGRCGAPAISSTKKLCQSCLEKLNREVSDAQKGIKLGDKKKVELGEYSASARDMLDKKRR